MLRGIFLIKKWEHCLDELFNWFSKLVGRLIPDTVFCFGLNVGYVHIHFFGSICIWVFLYLHTCVGQWLTPGVFLFHSPLCTLSSRISQWTWISLTELTWLANKDSPILTALPPPTHPRDGIPDTTLSFYKHSRNPNSSPLACIARNLLAAPCLQILDIYFSALHWKHAINVQ